MFVHRQAILLQEPIPVRALSTLSLMLSRNPPSGVKTNPLMGSFDEEESPGLLPSFLSGASSFSYSIPTQLISIPLLRRKVMQPSKPTLAFLEPLPGQSEDEKEWANVGSARVTSGMVSVGRADADRYWYAAGSSGATAPGSALGLHNGKTPEMWAGLTSARSRGELQTHSVSLRFDAHLSGIRCVESSTLSLACVF